MLLCVVFKGLRRVVALRQSTDIYKHFAPQTVYFLAFINWGGGGVGEGAGRDQSFPAGPRSGTLELRG